uniref:Serpin B6 n=1 Tax=Sinocyclocheilus anshuiensis TaxID=1608454 RepID=A0A671K6I8_9TELE
MEPLSAANTQFSLKLFKKISGGNTSGNVFYSPISISSALAMVSLGAKENTAAQMFEVRQRENKTRNFNKLMSELKKPGAPYVLSLANRLYGEQSYQFVEVRLKAINSTFVHDAARVDINKWVEKNTQGKIKDLVPQGTIDAMTRLVLVNAIYFEGNWEEKFPKDATRDGQFKLNKMNSQVLELPYVGKNLSMLIILPNEIQDETTGLQKLEKALTYEKLMEWTRPEVMHQQEVEVSLPRFKMEETYDMKSLLISMGMEDVFDGQKVNLSGMSPNNDLVVTKVIHKAFVEVNEEGTEAAVANGIVMEGCSLWIPPVFNADHPFLFFIRHNRTKSILFYGRFCSP